MMTLSEAQAEADSGAETDAVLSRGETPRAELPAGDALRQAVRDAIEDRGLTQDSVGREIGRSGSAVNQWLHGKYKGDVAAIDADMQKWLARNADADALGAHAGGPAQFVETNSAKAYIATFRYAQSMGTFGVLYGTSGTGKSEAAKHYAAIRTGVRIMTASPAERTLVPFLKRLARYCGIARPVSAASDLTDAIIDKVKGSRGLIIIDEADHVDVTPVEQLRYIHDQTGIGAVLIGNDTVYSQLTGGARVTELARIYSRIGKRQRATCLPADIDAIAKSCGITGRAEINFLRQIGSKPGHLRNVVQVIRQAGIRAAGKDAALSLDDLGTAWTNLGAEV